MTYSCGQACYHNQMNLLFIRCGTQFAASDTDKLQVKTQLLPVPANLLHPVNKECYSFLSWYQNQHYL